MRRWLIAGGISLAAVLPQAAAGQALQPQTAQADSVRDGAGWGALAGAGAAAALHIVEVSSCRIGCEYDLPGAAAIVQIGMGAAVGSLVGWIVDRTSDTPRRAIVRVGPSVTHTTIASLAGGAAAPGISLAVQVSRFISLHAEYVRVDHTFGPAPGDVPDHILENIVPATTRMAGWSRGIESKHVSYTFSELVGFQFPGWGPVRVGLLGGVGLQSAVTRSYYDAWQQTGIGTRENPARVVQLPGKYYVLNFESPDPGVVLGIDAEIAIARGLVAVPMVRYHRVGDPGPSLKAGTAVQWKF